MGPYESMKQIIIVLPTPPIVMPHVLIIQLCLYFPNFCSLVSDTVCVTLEVVGKLLLFCSIAIQTASH